MNNTNVLIVTEGPDDKKIIRQMLRAYRIADQHHIFVFETNIYCLYDVMEKESDGDWEEMDLPLLLKSYATNEDEKEMLKQHFSEIILAFDYDPQHPTYSLDKIEKMYTYFSNASEKGKLYINYPMVEAAYHFKDFPNDESYKSRIVLREQLENHEYKSIVDMDSKHLQRILDYSNDGVIKNSIEMNLKKALYVYSGQYKRVDHQTYSLLDFKKILKKQAELYETQGYIYVLFTAAFYLIDYGSSQFT